MIKYIYDEQGQKIEVIIPIELWQKMNGLMSNNSFKHMDREKLKEYMGKIKLTVDAATFQEEIRNEWE